MMNVTYRFGGERSAHVQDSYVLCVARRHLACGWCLREVVLIQLCAATDVSRQQKHIASLLRRPVTFYLGIGYRHSAHSLPQEH